MKYALVTYVISNVTIGNQTWSTVTNNFTPSPRAGHRLARLFNNVFIFGGNVGMKNERYQVSRELYMSSLQGAAKIIEATMDEACKLYLKYELKSGEHYLVQFVVEGKVIRSYEGINSLVLLEFVDEPKSSPAHSQKKEISLKKGEIYRVHCRVLSNTHYHMDWPIPAVFSMADGAILEKGAFMRDEKLLIDLKSNVTRPRIAFEGHHLRIKIPVENPESYLLEIAARGPHSAGLPANKRKPSNFAETPFAIIGSASADFTVALPVIHQKIIDEVDSQLIGKKRKNHFDIEEFSSGNWEYQARLKDRNSDNSQSIEYLSEWTAFHRHHGEIDTVDIIVEEEGGTVAPFMEAEAVDLELVPEQSAAQVSQDDSEQALIDQNEEILSGSTIPAEELSVQESLTDIQEARSETPSGVQTSSFLDFIGNPEMHFSFSLKYGDRLEVKWGKSWYVARALGYRMRAEKLEINIHYEGWIAKEDKWILLHSKAKSRPSLDTKFRKFTGSEIVLRDIGGYVKDENYDLHSDTPCWGLSDEVKAKAILSEYLIVE